MSTREKLAEARLALMKATVRRSEACDAFHDAMQEENRLVREVRDLQAEAEAEIAEARALSEPRED